MVCFSKIIVDIAFTTNMANYKIILTLLNMCIVGAIASSVINIFKYFFIIIHFFLLEEIA